MGTRDNALPNIAVYDILRKRLYAMAGGAAHIGAPPTNDPAPGFHTMSADALDTFHMYRGVTARSSAMDTSGTQPSQLSSKCCNFIDQHDIEYVLWDRRAYARDWMVPILKERVLPPRCLYKQCKDNPSMLPEEKE